MTGAGEVDRLLAGEPDQPGDVGVDERQPGAGPPVTEQSGLDVLDGQRTAQQRVVLQVDLADGQVVVGSPPGVQDGDLGVVQVREVGRVVGVAAVMRASLDPRSHRSQGRKSSLPHPERSQSSGGTAVVDQGPATCRVLGPLAVAGPR